MLKRLLKPLTTLILLALLLALPAKALAHPLDQFVQSAYITIGDTQIEVEMDLSPGILVAPSFLPTIDTNSDNRISNAEGEAYAQQVLGNLTLQVDGITQTLNLDLKRLEIPEYNVLQAGYGTFRVFAVTSAPTSTGQTSTITHHISFANTYEASTLAYQVNAFVAKGASITFGKQNRSSNQQSLEMDYTATTTSTAASTGTITSTTSTTSTSTSPSSANDPASNPLLGLLSGADQSIWLLFGALGLALLLGGLHALTPGHGKTLAAAYLVGSRGTIKHAVALGGIVTITHTSSVIIIGLIAYFASRFILPDVLVPTLEVISGLMVLYIGARLAYLRFRAFRSGTTSDLDHGHSHDPNDPNSHTHDFTSSTNHSHSDPTNPQSAIPNPKASAISPRRSLMAMGISGGIIPCPEALGVMLFAISIQRVVFGLGMIVAFSVGLALVLIGIGILLVKARSVMTRLTNAGSPLQRYLPLASALIVTILGLSILLKGITAYLG